MYKKINTANLGKKIALSLHDDGISAVSRISDQKATTRI
jgi:hypothetical protein